MIARKRVRDVLRFIDDWTWRTIFGKADYLQLRPPISLRLKLFAHLPLCVGRSPHSRPIFVVGCPRSGTTILVDLLRRSTLLGHLGQESHWIWESLRNPLRAGSDDQSLDAADVDWVYRLFVKSCYRAAFGERRFVDKCPTNSLRVGAIKAVFPNAHIVTIWRNGPDTVSSLIDTWLDPVRFPGFEVPVQLAIDGYDQQRWVHVLQPGWRQVASSSIERVCAHQWVATNEALLSARSSMPANGWLEVRYEEFVENAEGVARDLFAQLGLPFEASIAEFVRNLKRRVVNTRTKPEIGKWRRRNPERIRRILSLLEPTMERLGYGAPR